MKTNQILHLSEVLKQLFMFSDACKLASKFIYLLTAQDVLLQTQLTAKNSKLLLSEDGSREEQLCIKNRSTSNVNN